MIPFVPRGHPYEPESYTKRQRRLNAHSYPTELSSCSAELFDVSSLVSSSLGNIVIGLKEREAENMKQKTHKLTEDEFNKKYNLKKNSWFDNLIDFLTVYK
jgi:hypothetical protein